ncbi:CerR family C-terminal domain-containing protein [Methylomonas koyamae]|uniref:CerR family C-terminal domain-containing protein n=1 Tax=Methylomonas koyamae TaxID=702114 RepID=UPI0028735D52|nr:CerR family C-terminal domain-containing protein [Methylomonas koyamae]WNB76273.1 CerR family C-terminal domain-containing protein [Methylomonas koyamae]
MAKTPHAETETSDARSRLVSAALRLFAEKGYEGASTREICEAAGVNISAIRYYFGDKAGLYRAAFTEPMGESPCGANIAEYADLPLPEVLHRFFGEFLEPLKKGEELGLVMKLHFREMIEPTGAWQQEIDAEIKPQHDGLVALLQTHLGLDRADDDLHRLAFAITGMAVHFYVGQDVIATVSAPLLNTPAAVDTLAERLAGYAVSMVAGEAARRAQGGEHAA